MITFLAGKIDSTSENSVVIDVNGVGYEVFVPSSLFGQLHAGHNVKIFTHHYIKEDRQQLYGFMSLEGKEFFEMLISVSGVGPKSALAIMSAASHAALRNAIVMRDHALFASAQGIGKKTAEKIVIDLQNKISGGVSVVASGDIAHNDAFEVIEALLALGYSESQSRDALANIDTEHTDISAKVKAALQYLGS